MKKVTLLLTLVFSFIQFSQSQNLGSWNVVGPVNFPVNISGQINGIGRVTQVKFDPINPNIFYCTSASGGLWKSTNSGTTWTVLGTDALTSTSCASICIDHTQNNILYLGTGDPNYYGNSVGLLKSVDGGLTWSPSNAGIGTRMALEILMLPSNNSGLLIATSNGIYKSLDAGVTWLEKKHGGEFTDMIFKPNSNGQTVYACTMDSFFVSTNAGDTWSNIPYTPPTPGGNAGGMRLGVSANNDAIVYLAGIFYPSNGDNYCAVYKSSNSGNSFTGVYINNNQNLTGYDAASGGQGNYNFDMTVDPADENKVFIASHCVWRSDDGGISWNKLTNWWDNCHTDMHHIVHVSNNNSKILNANDGGIFSSTDDGATWNPMSDGLEATEIYKAAQSPIRKDMISIGTQDNGELFFQQATSWQTNRGGDWGSRMIFDYENPTTVYYYENNNRRDVTSSDVSLQGPFNPGNATEYAFNPLDSNLCFIGDTGIYRTNNLQLNPPNWLQIGLNNLHILALESSQLDKNLLFAIGNDNKLYVSHNASSNTPSFTNYNLPEPVNIKAVLVSLKSNNNILFAAIDQHVYRSPDQGITWSDVTGTLPLMNVIGMVQDVNATDESIYIANAKSVWHSNNSLPDWINYSNGLPLVANISDFMIFNNNTFASVLRVSFYGRGVWESGLYNSATSLPYSNFTADTLVGCPGLVVHFSDVSAPNISQWQWSFPGGSPTTSTQQNPVVTYNTEGLHAVTLTVTNGNGQNTQTKISYINIVSNNNLPLTESFEGNLFPPSNWRLGGSSASNNWQHESTVGSFGLSGSSSKFDNYSYNANGERADLITDGINLSQLSAQGVFLTFDVAYALYPGYEDSLAVYYSSDCGLTRNQIYLKKGSILATAPDYSAGAFIPTNTQWRNDTIDISNLTGNNNVLFYFTNIGHYGQVLYVDNINITDTNSYLNIKPNLQAENSSLLVYLKNNKDLELILNNNSSNNNDVFIYDASGNMVFRNNFHDSHQTIDVASLSSGLYIVVVGNKKAKFVKQEHSSN